MMKNQNLINWLAISGTLILIGLSRFILLPDLYFDQDEIWSTWQASGTFREVFTRNPFDFPAGFYLLLYGWHIFVGISPFVMRVFLILIFLINVSFVFVLAQRLFQKSYAGYFATLAYAALGYIVYLSVLLRPYTLVMLTFSMTFYLILRYFDKPNWKNGAIVGLAMASMWYSALTAFFAYAVIGLYTFTRGIRNLRLWVLPGFVALVIAFPEIWSKLSVVLERTSQVFETAALPSLHVAIYQRLVDYFGTMDVAWFVLVILAVIISLSQKRTNKRYLIFFIIWLLGGICSLYVSHSRTNFFQFARYGWWLAPAIALLITQAIVVLPQRMRYVAGIGLIVLLFIPQSISSYKEPIADFESTFQWWQDHYSAGDVIIIDANCDCQRADVWAYYERVYFPSGLEIVNEIQGHHRRVWYVRTIDNEDSLIQSAVTNNRIPARFFGSPRFFLQLYVAPPDPNGIIFENGLRFHGYEVLTEQSQQIESTMIYRPEGAELSLRLWWSIDEPLTQDYSVGVQIFNDRWGLYAQDDQSPHPIYLQPNIYDYDAPLGTMSTWVPNTYYVEERVIFLPYETRLRRTQFTVYMTVYQWWDGVRLSAETTNDDNLLPLFDFTIMAW
ncbi:MAG: glycosyltransferase family 39 protein [Chloroflexota bacterium]